MSKMHFTYAKQRKAKKEQMMFSQMRVTMRRYIDKAQYKRTKTYEKATLMFTKTTNYNF